MAFKVKVSEDLETSVPGIFAIGDVAGGTLIRHALNHGADVVSSIKKYLSSHPLSSADAHIFDVAVVGGGPGGINCALQCVADGLRPIVFETQRCFQTIREYPDDKPLYDAKPPTIEKGVLPFSPGEKKDVLARWEEIVKRSTFPIHEWEAVEQVKRQGTIFLIKTSRGSYYARTVVLAMGKREPKRLRIPGEDLPKVRYYLQNPQDYQGKRILIVGGGNAAIEAALLLAERNHVSISYRQAKFFRLIEQNQCALEKKRVECRIELLFKTIPQEILPDSVVLALLDDEGKHTGQTLTIPNDFVFLYLGFELPERFLTDIGVALSDTP